MRIGVLASCALAVAAFAWAQGNVEKWTKNCVREKAPAVADNLYKFQFDSGVLDSDDPDTFVARRCVFNHRFPRRLWVDWEKTGVKGLTDVEGVIKSELAAGTKKFKLVKTVLFYGAQPKKQDAPYREPDEKIAAEASAGGTLSSRVQMGVPEKKADSPEAEEKLRVRDIDLMFKCTAFLDTRTKQYVYSYCWCDRKAVKSPLLEVRMLFHAKLPGIGPEPLTMSDIYQGFEFRDKLAPVQRNVVLSFVVGQNAVGQAPVSIFLPEGKRSGKD